MTTNDNSEQPVSISWTPEKLLRLRAAYQEAAKTVARDGTFMFDGHQFVLGYAKYLIQYLEGQFNVPPPSANN